MPKNKIQRRQPRRSQRIAAEVYRRYGNSLRRIFEAENIHLREDDRWWKEFLIADEVRKEIAINRRLGREEKRSLIAHALGHYFLHGGNRFYFAEKDPTVLDRDEQEAWEFAAYLLIREERLDLWPHQSVEAFARLHRVTPALVRLRLILLWEDQLL